MKKVGIHIRLDNTLTECIEKATRLELNTFQSFFIKNSGDYIRPDDHDIKEFLYLRKNFNDIFVHGSFWVNLCNTQEYNLRILKKEINLAKKLEYTHIVLHPGSAKEFQNKMEGIDLLAGRLDKILKQEKNIKIVLENTAHAKYTVGSDLRDFKILQDKLDNQLLYCIDTAHAYSFGYDIATESHTFIHDVDKYIGLENVVLIHLNESMESLGSRKDKHGTPGEGKIGIQGLQNFINNEAFIDKPIILELPHTLSEKEEIAAIQLFK